LQRCCAHRAALDVVARATEIATLAAANDSAQWCVRAFARLAALAGSAEGDSNALERLRVEISNGLRVIEAQKAQ
jgi:hypothetical protein